MATQSLTRVLQELRGAALRHDAADGDLLEAFVRGHDEAAFAALVRRHGPMVLGVCRRLLRHAQDAEDAFQATFLVLARKAAAVRPRGQVGNWLYGVARRTALEARRRNARRRGHEQAAMSTHPNSQDAADLWGDLQPLLDDELARLPDKYRTAVVLCDLEGRPRREAAQELRVPEGTLSSRLAGGRKLLAARLRQRGVELGAGALAVLLARQGTPAVPAALATATARVGVVTITGGTAAVSAEVAALTAEVLRTMWITKYKWAAALLPAALVCGLMWPSVSEPARAEKPLPAVAQAPAPHPARAPAARQEGGAWKERATLQGHEGGVFTLAFAADYLASGGQDGRVRLWNVQTAAETQTLFDKNPFGEIILVVPRDNDRRLGIISRMGEVHRLLLYRLEKKVGGGAGGPGMRLLTLLGDARTAACVGVNNVLLLRDFPLIGLPQTAPDELYKGHTGRIHAVAFSADEQVLATAGADRTVRLWQRGREDEKFKGSHAAEVVAVALTPDGKTLASADRDGKIKLWDAAAGKELAVLDGHKKAVWALAASPDGKLLASAGEDGTVRLWDVATGKQVALLTGHKGAGYCLAFSRDGRTLASGGEDGMVKLWSPTK
jgi:RNA polymerase sigma factor (sigma-70 family)